MQLSDHCDHITCLMTRRMVSKQPKENVELVDIPHVISINDAVMDRPGSKMFFSVASDTRNRFIVTAKKTKRGIVQLSCSNSSAPACRQGNCAHTKLVSAEIRELSTSPSMVLSSERKKAPHIQILFFYAYSGISVS
jgi:hypothetical protein